MLFLNCALTALMQRDPGEYLVELQRFAAIKDPELRCHAIDLHLGRHDAALRHLVAAGPACFPQVRPQPPTANCQTTANCQLPVSNCQFGTSHTSIDRVLLSSLTRISLQTAAQPKPPVSDIATTPSALHVSVCKRLLFSLNRLLATCSPSHVCLSCPLHCCVVSPHFTHCTDSHCPFHAGVLLQALSLARDKGLLRLLLSLLDQQPQQQLKASASHLAHTGPMSQGHGAGGDSTQAAQAATAGTAAGPQGTACTAGAAQGVEQWADFKARRCAVLCALGSVLGGAGRHEDAGLSFMAAGAQEEAMRSYRWRFNIPCLIGGRV